MMNFLKKFSRKLIKLSSNQSLSITKIDWPDLPELALIRVLNYLPVRDQLNARLVCKHWRLITDSSARRDELVLFFESHPMPVYWFHNGSEVHPGNVCLLSDLDALKNEFFLRYFRRVRRLVIALQGNIVSQKFIEAIQTSFPQLEHLQFNLLGPKCQISSLRKLVYETPLQLPNLRTFYSQVGDMPRALHCPRLTELFVYSELAINETTDEQTRLCIQNLKFLLVQKLTYPPNFDFSNLEVLYFNKPSLSIILSDFPRLKELHYFDGTSEVHDELRDALGALLEQKRSLKRDELRFYFDGFELKDVSDFGTLNGYLHPDQILYTLDLNEKVLQLIKEGSSRCKFNLLRKQMQVSDRLDDELVDLPEGDELVESMFKSTEAIRFVQPLTRHSPNLFELFGRFRYVSSVQVVVELRQVLLDRLPDALPHLLSFAYYPEFFSDHFVNFEFVGRFKSLNRFVIPRNVLSMDELRSITNNCKLLQGFFLTGPTKILIDRRAFGLKSTDQVFRAEWLSDDFVDFARAEFSNEELFDYLEASRWLEKNDFLGERKEKKLPGLLLRPIYEQWR